VRYKWSEYIKDKDPSNLLRFKIDFCEEFVIDQDTHEFSYLEINGKLIFDDNERGTKLPTEFITLKAK